MPVGGNAQCSRRREGEAMRDIMERRCQVTHNPCGTDTWEAHTPCRCRACQAYLMDTIERLRADLARYRAVAEAARAYREWVRSIYKDEPTFHFAPLKQAMFDAVDALDSPGGGGAHD